MMRHLVRVARIAASVGGIAVVLGAAVHCTHEANPPVGRTPAGPPDEQPAPLVYQLSCSPASSLCSFVVWQRGRGADLYVLDYDAGSVTRVPGTRLGLRFRGPSFSPDGGMLAVSVRRVARDSALYLSGIVVWKLSEDGKLRDPTTLGGGVLVQYPFWSADSTELAWSWQNPVASGSQLQTTSLRTGELRVLASGVRAGLVRHRWGAPERILFYRMGQQGPELWFVGDPARGPRRLEDPPPMPVGAAAVAPGGDAVAVVRALVNRENAGGPLDLVDTDTGTSRRLAEAAVGMPDWSGDGAMLVVAEAANAGRSSTRIVRVTREGQRTALTRHAAARDQGPVFGYDDETVLFVRGGRSVWRVDVDGTEPARVWELPDDSRAQSLGETDTIP